LFIFHYRFYIVWIVKLKNSFDIIKIYYTQKLVINKNPISLSSTNRGVIKPNVKFFDLTQK